MAEQVTVFVKPGDPGSDATLRYLEQRGVTYTKRDVLTDPSATAILFGRLGRVTTPVVQIGDRLLVGHDPVQLARFLPRDGEVEPTVSFGAAVRSVTAQIAADKGLPAIYGVEVGSVHAGSPAEAAGIVPGDVITAIGPYTIQGGADQFRRAVALRRPGDSMALSLWRAGGTTDAIVSFPSAPRAEEPTAAT